jgi:hypothetical protein
MRHERVRKRIGISLYFNHIKEDDPQQYRHYFHRNPNNQLCGISFLSITPVYTHFSFSPYLLSLSHAAHAGAKVAELVNDDLQRLLLFFASTPASPSSVAPVALGKASQHTSQRILDSAVIKWWHRKYNMRKSAI